jgi:hypothetical protein
MADDGKSSAWIGFLGAVVAALIAGGFALWPSLHSADAPGGGSVSPPRGGNVEPPPLVVMGQLEPNINRQGLDFSDQGIAAPNAAVCAEFCRTNGQCKAMTYVISLRTCWLKSGVPPPFQPGGPDYVSAIKQ